MIDMEVFVIDFIRLKVVSITLGDFLKKNSHSYCLRNSI